MLPLLLACVCVCAPVRRVEAQLNQLSCRLRAGLCDRCTVTQELARRRQQEFEASHMQTVQHISLIGASTPADRSAMVMSALLTSSDLCVTAGEMNTLKKENKRLKEEVKALRAALQ